MKNSGWAAFSFRLRSSLDSYELFAATASCYAVLGNSEPLRSTQLAVLGKQVCPCCSVAFAAESCISGLCSLLPHAIPSNWDWCSSARAARRSRKFSALGACCFQ